MFFLFRVHVVYHIVTLVVNFGNTILAQSSLPLRFRGVRNPQFLSDLIKIKDGREGIRTSAEYCDFIKMISIFSLRIL